MEMLNSLTEALTRAKIAAENEEWREAINWHRIAVDRACSLAAWSAGQMDYIAYKLETETTPKDE